MYNNCDICRKFVVLQCFGGQTLLYIYYNSSTGKTKLIPHMTFGIHISFKFVNDYETIP